MSFLKTLARKQDGVAGLVLNAGADPDIVHSGGLLPAMLIQVLNYESWNELLGRYKV